MNSVMSMPLSTPYLYVPSSKKTKTIALGITVLLHVFLVAVITSTWMLPEHEPVKLNSLKIQTYQLPKPAPVIIEPKKVVVPKPAEPIVEPPKPKPVEKKEFAFKRVEKKQDQPKPKPKPEKKVVKKAAPKPTPTPTPTPPVTQPVVEVAKPIAPTQHPIKATETIPSAVSTDSEPFDVSQYYPIQKDAPEYPRSAIRKGLEGDCTVEYTVTPAGTVKSPVVVGDCPVQFVKPSIEAAKHFRYAPRIVNGQAVAVSKVKNTFEYRIQ